MDPATVTAIGAILGWIREYGPWGLAVAVIAGVLGVWRSGEFLPKSIHDTIVTATTQRYLDLLDRFNAGQEALKLWREAAERAAKAAEVAQSQHADILTRLEALRREMEELRDDLRERDGFGSGRPPGRRPGAREGA